MLACALFSLAGLIVAGLAWRTFWQVRTEPPSFRPACAVSETVDCAKTAKSDYAVFLGVPTALWGALGFAAVVVLSLVAARPRRRSDFPSGIVFGLTLGAAGVSVLMAILSNLVLGVLCLECTAMQSLSLLSLACASLHLREIRRWPWSAALDDLAFLRDHLGRTAGVALALLAGAGLLIVAYPDHHRAVRKVKAPGLDREITPPAAPAELGVPEGTTDEGHPYLGADPAVVTVFEFSDYECPFCRAAHYVLRDIVAHHPDRIRLVHVSFPLDQSCNRALERPFHRQACALARAAACGNEQGRFWAVNDRIFEFTEAHGPVDLDALAEDAGLDPAAFRACLDGPAAAARVARDLEQGGALLEAGGFGTGTPFFEIRDEAGGVVGRYFGFGGDEGVPEDVLRRLDAGWPEEWKGAPAQGRQPK